MGDVGFGIRVDLRYERPALRAALTHEDSVIAQQNLCVDDPPADRTDAARQLVEHEIRIDARAINDRRDLFVLTEN
jgi:hypothetical protein